MNTGAGFRQQPAECSSAEPGTRNYLKGSTVIMVNVSRDGQVFRCEICGNVVVVKEAGGGELICCGEPMQLEE